MDFQAFVIDPTDNVATALADLAPGEVRLVGTAPTDAVAAVEPIRHGHKLALRDISEGEPIIKYGAVIGIADRPIPQGAWVHLHNLRSQFDERSGTLDADTGEPTEGGVYV